MLRRWWTKKYKLPWTSNNIEELTIVDLLTEFYEDLYESDKTALWEASRGEDGEIMFEETGDPLFDKWEKEFHMGITPDLTEGLPEEDRAALFKEQARAKRARELAPLISEIDERFDEAIRIDPRYATKSAGELGRGRPSSIDPLDLLGKGK